MNETKNEEVIQTEATSLKTEDVKKEDVKKEDSASKNGIVKNDSKGYNYHYASLSDIAKQNYTIPPMKIQVIGDSEYVFYKDDAGEWQQGSKIVVPSNNRQMNEAQLYGAALTYARRYTTLMALGLACDDDDNLENKEEPKKGKTQEVKLATPAQKKIISEGHDKVAEELKTLGIKNSKELDKLTVEQASELCAKIIKGGK